MEFQQFAFAQLNFEKDRQTLSSDLIEQKQDNNYQHTGKQSLIKFGLDDHNHKVRKIIKIPVP